MNNKIRTPYFLVDEKKLIEKLEILKYASEKSGSFRFGFESRRKQPAVGICADPVGQEAKRCHAADAKRTSGGADSSWR